MIIHLFRIFIFVTLCIFIYSAYQYYHNPLRHLRKAKQKNTFFLLDDINNTKQNLQFVYKGCSFEGEKYVGTTKDAFVVANINIIVQEPSELIGLTKDDLIYLEQEIHQSYPHAIIKWKHPINQLLVKKEKAHLSAGR